MLENEVSENIITAEQNQTDIGLKDYELLYVIRPDLTDEAIGTVRSDVRTQVEKFKGVVVKEDPWGKRQLAYEVKDFTEGIYTLVDLKLTGDGPRVIQEQLKIDERIIRYIVTVKEHRLKEKKQKELMEQKLKAQKEKS